MAASKGWWRTRWRGLPLQFLFSLLLPLALLLLLVAFGGAVLHQQAMRSLVGERDERAARAAAAAIGEQLDHRARVVQGLALRAAAGETPEDVLAGADPFLPDFEGGFVLFGPDGSVLAATRAADWATLATQPPSGNMEGADGTFSGLASGQNGDEGTMLASNSQAGFRAVGAFLPVTLIRRSLSPAFSMTDDTTAFVVTSEGAEVFRQGSARATHEGALEHPGVASALRGESGTSYRTIDGQEHILAYSPIPQVEWALVIEESWHVVGGPLLRLTEWAPLVLAPLLVVTLIGLGFGIRQVVQPLQALAGKATALTWGDFSAIEEPVGGIAEIQRLQTELVHMAARIQAAQLSLRGYLGAVTAGQEEERRRLARELHDDTIQALIALNQRIQLAQMAQPEPSLLGEMQEMVTGLIASLRRTIHALRPIYLEDLGLVPALHVLAQEVGSVAGLPVHFETAGQPRRLEPEVELALYRIAQEALNNVVRHAGAREARVALSYEPDAVALTISDDGRGFAVPVSPAELAPQGHYGLLSIHERAELIRSKLSIESEPGQGTSLQLRVPA